MKHVALLASAFAATLGVSVAQAAPRFVRPVASQPQTTIKDISGTRGLVTPGTPMGAALFASATTMVATHWVHGKIGVVQPESKGKTLDTPAFDY